METTEFSIIVLSNKVSQSALTLNLKLKKQLKVLVACRHRLFGLITSRLAQSVKLFSIPALA